MKRIFFIALFFVASCSGSKYLPDIVDVQEENLPQEKIIDYNAQSLYEVTNADSLASIARKYDTTADVLILMNNLKRPYILKPGTIIKVPTVKTLDSYGKKDEEEMESLENQKIIQIKPSNKSN